jgi:hypothetical protein
MNTPGQDLSDEFVQHQAMVAGAKARTPGDWFDIYNSIVEHGVKTTMESNGEGALAAERLRERKGAAKEVRHILESHGMPLSEAIEIEGPYVTNDERGITTQVSWPQGQWMRLHWPDHSTVEFRGAKAWVALGFIMWWEQFHQQFKALEDSKAPQPVVKRRLIEPNSPEWKNYFGAKARDQKKGLEP